MRNSYARTVIVTGAASGIGRALAVAWARKGFTVGIADIDMDRAGATLDLVRRSGGTGEVFRCDVSRVEDVQAMADHFFAAWEKVGILVNNAGIGLAGPVGEVTIEDWEKVVGVNLWGVIYGCHAFIPRMKEQGGGHIVNTSSTAGLAAVSGFAPYVTTKTAVIALSETLKVDLAPFDIGVTVICPTAVKTNVVDTSRKTVGADEYLDRADVDWGVEMIETAMEQSPLTAEELATKVVRAVDKNRLFVVPRTAAKLNWISERVSPSLYYGRWAWLNRLGLARRLIMVAARKGIV